MLANTLNSLSRPATRTILRIGTPSRLGDHTALAPTEWRWLESRTPSAAAAILEREPVDAFLLALDARDYDAFAPLRAAHPDLALVCLVADRDQAWAAASLRADHILTMPCEPEMVLNRLAHALNGERVRPERVPAHQLVQLAAHELKKPLQDFHTIVFLLREVLGDNPNALALIQRADETQRKMHDIVRVFLDVLGTVEPRFTDLNAGDIVRATCHQFAEDAARKGIGLSVVEPSSAVVRADSRLLLQAVSNLVSNAVKFSPPGTMVRLQVVASGDVTRINVIDQGPGVPPNERSRLFKAYMPLTPRPTANEGSSGLGLWIVRYLMEMQGGRAGAEFPREGGSVFWVEMPAQST